MRRMLLALHALGLVKECPPSQRPGSFSIDAVLEALQRGAQGGSR